MTEVRISGKEKTNKLKHQLLSGILLYFVLPPVAGLYGSLHDQVSFTVSPEYFTKFKFLQFGIYDQVVEISKQGIRMAVAEVGFKATWWIGILVAIAFNVMGLFIEEKSGLYKLYLKAIARVLLVAFICALLGLLYGYFVLKSPPAYYFVPEHLEDVRAFTAVGTMHNWSYLGGLIGLLVACYFLFKSRNQSKQAF